MKISWRIFTMSEMYQLMNKETSTIFIQPNFPTRRWGQVTTETSTTDIVAINKAIVLLKEQGHTVRKRIYKDMNTKFRKFGNFYSIEIKENCS